MTACRCHARSDEDFLNHDAACPYFLYGVKKARDTAAAELEGTADRLEQLAERLSALPVGGGVNHRVANVRMMMMGEAFRLRRTAIQLKRPFEKFSASG